MIARDLVGLSAADLVQRRIGLALEAPFGVPRGAPVPQDQDAAHLAGAAGRRRSVDERDERAVLPEPLEGVEHALLGVLDVDDDVAVVEQHPAPVALALAAHRLGAGRRSFSSTSSTMASTWRSLSPVTMTKTSVMASRSLTSMRTMSVASLSAAACAAVWASCTASSVAVMLAPRSAERSCAAVSWRLIVSSLRPVEAVLGDVLHDAVRDEVPDRSAGRRPAPGSRSTRSPSPARRAA